MAALVSGKVPMSTLLDLHDLFAEPEYDRYHGTEMEPYLKLLHDDPAAVAAALRAELARRKATTTEGA